MKNYVRVMVLSILLAAISPGANLFAQNSDEQDSLIDSLQKRAREVEKSTEKMKSDTAKGENGIKEKSNAHTEEQPDQGAAYGKSKGELSGREFGQWRSEEARNKIKTKLEELEDQITRIEEVLKETQMKLEEFKFELARKQKAGEFSSDEQQLKRRERIQAAEEKSKQLEAEIEKEKQALRHMKDEIADQAADAQERQE